MDEKQLNEFNIFGLREYARRTGVASPTSKRKEQLIQEILAIQSGEMKPHIAKTKQGRPPKEFGYEFVDNMARSDIGLTKVVTFNQHAEGFEVGGIKTVVGYVEIFANNSALLNVLEHNEFVSYFVSPSIVENFGLRFGDKICAEIELKDGQVVIKSILNINDCPISRSGKTRKNFEKLTHEIPTENVKFENKSFEKFEIKKGESVYFYGNNNNENTISLIKLLNAAKFDRKIYLNISVADKNRIFLNELKNSEQFAVNLTADVDVAKKAIMLSVERAKRAMENGEDVAILIDDLLSVKSVDNDVMTMLKSIVTITKNTKKNGSITLLSIMPISTLSLAEKLADRRIQIGEI